jgi:hypothetical protein
MYSTIEKSWEERIVIPFRQFVGLKSNELPDLLGHFINTKLGGKCNEYGYMLPNSASIVSHTSAKIEHDMVSFYATISAKFFICNIGDVLKMRINTITQIGIKGGYAGESPYMIYVPIEFISGDKISDGMPLFNIGDIIDVKVEAVRFSIGDTMITCIGKYDKDTNVVVKRKAKKTKTYDSDSDDE